MPLKSTMISEVLISGVQYFAPRLRNRAVQDLAEADEDSPEASLSPRERDPLTVSRRGSSEYNIIYPVLFHTILYYTMI